MTKWKEMSVPRKPWKIFGHNLPIRHDPEAKKVWKKGEWKLILTEDRGYEQATLMKGRTPAAEIGAYPSIGGSEFSVTTLSKIMANPKKVAEYYKKRLMLGKEEGMWDSELKKVV